MRRLAILGLLATAGCLDRAPAAPESTAPNERLGGGGGGRPRYDVVTLGSLGTTQSRGMGIANRGWVAGWSIEGDSARRATLWRDRTPQSLGTLGGPHSMVPWPGINDAGMVVGVSHTEALDPLGENWSCEFGGFLPATSPRRVCRGFAWYDGRMHELPTLGGAHGFATGVNDRGQVVGWSETRVLDPTCRQETGQRRQFRATLWEPRRGRMVELRPYPGDSTSAATAINGRGLVVGISGDCDQAVGRYSARHAVLWNRRGVPIEIPNLGGSAWHTPMDINERGDVVGFSNLDVPGDETGAFVAHAFYWARGSRRAVDLGTLPDDTLSQALGVNDRRQVVGISYGNREGRLPHAFLWRDGVMTDLNDLVDVRPNVLLSAQHVNDRGQITGRIQLAATGEVRAFVATPRRGSR